MLHCFDNVLITRAAAEVALELFTNFLLAGIGVFFAEVDGTQHHAWGTETALQAMALLEGGLHGVHGAIGLGQTLDGGNLGVGRLGQQHIARLHRVAVNNNGARAALGGVATHMGAGEVEVFTQGLHQQSIGCRLDSDRLAVNGEMGLHGKWSPETKSVVFGAYAKQVIRQRKTLK